MTRLDSAYGGQRGAPLDLLSAALPALRRFRLVLTLLAVLSCPGLPGVAGAESFFVTNTDPQGIGGVFNALADANENPGPDEIVFAVGSQTIFMTSQIFIADGLTVRATGGMPTLDGSNGPSTTRGIVMAGTNTRVEGLAIRNYPNVGIEVRGTNAEIEGCILSGSQFGVLVIDGAGAAAEGSVQIGAALTDGPGEGEGNFLYSNTFGVSVEPNVPGVSIVRNVVGIDENDVVTGNAVGVVAGGSATRVFDNVISGNSQFGLSIPGDDAVVAGNNIGLTRDEMSAAPNGTGVIVTGSEALIATLMTGGPPNVISGNAGDGLLLAGQRARILGARIGLHRTLPLMFPNQGHGILVSGGTDNEIGEGLLGNEIGGNGGHGIYIQGSFSTGNDVRNNVIGGAFPNGMSGLRIEGSGSDVGVTEGFGGPNEISGNDLNGVEIVGPDAFGNVLEGNTIEDNMGSGVRIVDASGNAVAGAFPNVIRGNGGNGVEVVSEFDPANANVIRKNEITDNDAFGIAVFDTAQGGIEAPTTQLVTPGVASGGVRGESQPLAMVDLYSDLEEEGEYYIGTVVADGFGDWVSPGSLALWGGTNLNAMQTSVNDNSSEFSVPLLIPPGRVNTEIPPDEDTAICLDLLSGDEVVPPTSSDATGRAVVRVDVVGTSVTVRIEHSVENPTAAELRMGLPGENGPLVMDLGPPETPIVAGLGGDELHAFTAGDHYLLISSVGEPDGEIRGTFACPEPGSALLALAALGVVAATARRSKAGVAR